MINEDYSTNKGTTFDYWPSLEDYLCIMQIIDSIINQLILIHLFRDIFMDLDGSN